MKNYTDLFIDFISSIQYNNLSDAAMKKMRACLADTLGVMIAGCADLYKKNEQLIQLMTDCSECINPIGMNEKTSLANAILINGLNAHFLELDDGIRYGVIHPSAPLFSALIPIAVLKNVSWKRFVLGSICGYETSIRLASAMQPSHYSAGFHPTATCCTIGVAVGIAVMLNYKKEVIKDAFSAAAISAYGTLKVLDDVSQLKPYNCGRAALLGYFAAMMAKAGYCGPNDVLSGETGFFHMMCSNFDENRLLNKDGGFSIEKIYLKPYASCRHTHPEIEAALMIRKKKEFDIGNVKGIHVTTYKGVIGKHDGRIIYGENSARMSIPYSIAVALCTGKAGIDEFTDKYIKNPLIQTLIKNCNIEEDDELSKLVPNKRVAIVRLLMGDGKVLEQKVEYPKGEPENPLSVDELFSKFISMTSHANFDYEKSVELFEIIKESDNIDIKILNV